MYFQRVLFISGLIYFAVSSLSIVKAMEDSDNDHRRGQRHSHSRSSSISGSSICADSDGATDVDDESDSDSTSNSWESSIEEEGEDGSASKRLKITSYLTVQEGDPFLQNIGGTVYVRGVIKEREDFVDQQNGDVYMPLSEVRKIDWSFPLSIMDCYLMYQGMSAQIAWLNLSNCGLDERRLYFLALGIKIRPTLEELRITETTALSPGALFHIVSMATSSLTLRHVDIYNVAVDDAALTSFLGVLGIRQGTLETLSVGYSITPVGLRSALSFLGSLDSFTLREFSMSVIGDFRDFDSNLVNRVLDKHPGLNLLVEFERGSQVDSSILKRLSQKYVEQSGTERKDRFDFEIRT